MKKRKYVARDEFGVYIDRMEKGRIRYYVEERVVRQIQWYDKKSSANQASYKKAMVVSIILGALIPVLTLLYDVLPPLAVKIVITLLGTGVAVVSAINALYKYKDLWVQYRTYCEILKSILHRYLTCCGEYKGKKPELAFSMFVDSCEEYMTKEYQVWATRIPPGDQTFTQPIHKSSGRCPV